MHFKEKPLIKREKSGYLHSTVAQVTSHLATRKTRHQQPRHQYEITYYIKSKPNKIFSEA